jgi:hypothetical protein
MDDVTRRTLLAALNQWLALTPPEPVKAHLKLDAQALAALPMLGASILQSYLV